MFGKDKSQLTSYSTQNGAGSDFLRNTIRAKIYAGDSVMEKKLTQYQLFWKYYNNQHWAENNDSLLSFNYVRAVVDKINNFIIGKEGFEVNIKNVYGDEVDPEVEKYYEALISFNWRMNKKKTLLQKIYQMGSVCGDCYVFLYPNETKGYVEYVLLDSRTTIPIFTPNGGGEVSGYKVIKLLGTTEKEYIQKVTEYTVGMVKTYYVKETGANADKFEVEEKPNDYDFIPVVHIENIPMSDSYGGKSDMEDIVKINKIYNEMAEDVKMIIDYYAQPTTVITGGTVGQLKRGINQIWSGLPSDAHVFNLTLGEDLSASMTFLKLLKDSIHDLSGVPEEVLSKVQHISNTSASALQMLYQPIVQVADKKSVSYGEGIELINKYTAYIYSTNIQENPAFKKLNAKEKVDKEFTKKYAPETIWKYNLPSDRLGILNEAVIEMSNNIGSRREVMERLGKENIPSLLTEIEADLKFKNENAVKPTDPNNPPVG